MKQNRTPNKNLTLTQKAVKVKKYTVSSMCYKIHDLEVRKIYAVLSL